MAANRSPTGSEIQWVMDHAPSARDRALGEEAWAIFNRRGRPNLLEWNVLFKVARIYDNRERRARRGNRRLDQETLDIILRKSRAARGLPAPLIGGRRKKGFY